MTKSESNAAFNADTSIKIERKTPDVVYAPDKWDYHLRHTVFLAGSIELGEAEKWQDKAAKLLVANNFVVLNPRRESKDWQDCKLEATDPIFREQVEWELDALERTAYIMMYFDPATQSPISLLELGLFARSYKMIVVCPPGFWRKGNVDMVCQKYSVTQAASIEQAVDIIVAREQAIYGG
jgi:hypothetical protein